MSVEKALRVAKDNTDEERVRKRLADPRVRKALDSERGINREYDIPYIAGISSDGKTLYVDRRVDVGHLLIGDRHEDVEEELWLHEGGERVFIVFFGDDYETAHRLITIEEHRMVTARGIDWDAYVGAFRHLSDALSHESITSVPRDLFLVPYAEGGDPGLLRRVQRAMR